MRRNCIHENNDDNKGINNVETTEDENIWVRERVTMAQKSVTNHKHGFHSIFFASCMKELLTADVFPCTSRKAQISFKLVIVIIAGIIGSLMTSDMGHSSICAMHCTNVQGNFMIYGPARGT